ARASRAGGTRLIGQAASGNTPPVRITSLSPNPAQDEVEVRFVSETVLTASSALELVLLDTRGVIVAQAERGGQVEAKGNGEYVARVRVSMLPSGTYTVRLRMGSETATAQIRVLR
ncbi:MAG: T9SS type A sorting domain-containing protein, partial [Candidatus Kapabacteria bacterium]|nr:T9SS type A sorting domain-containing protein [Candidatus Kapabacteria bacterium]